MTTTTEAIDWQISLERSNHRSDLAIELLNMLVADLPDYKQQVQIAYEQNDIPMLKHHLHKLHGSCCYCGVPRLHDIVISTENCVKQSNAKPTKELMKHLSDELDAVIQAAKEYIPAATS